MASKYWIKLYIEVLDDPKMGMLPADLWRFTVELFLLAGEINCNGTLQNVTQISWRLRYSVTQVETWLKQLEKMGIVTETADGWTVTKFEARQAASDVNERVKRHRERQKELKLKQNVTPVTVTPVTDLKRSNAPDTDTDIDIDTDIGSAAEKRRPPTVLAYKIFVEETKKSCLNMPQIKAINEAVGNDPAALEKWREVVKAWNLNGNKLTDAAGMLDWFKTGKRSNYDPNKFKNGGASDPAPVIAPPLDDAKRQAYAAMLAADREAAAESAARVGEIMANPAAGGVDAQKEIRKVQRKLAK